MILNNGENVKTKILKEPYPKNLLMTIQSTAVNAVELPIDAITDDVLAGLEYAISTLSEREQSVIKMRYQERKSFREIGLAHGVTLECARHNEENALRKLRIPKCLGYIKHGRCGYEKLIAKMEAEEKERMGSKLNITLEELDLSVRSFNRLKVHGCDTVADLIKLSEEDIVRIKNLGKRSIVEVARTLSNVGIKGTAWDEFLEED